MPQPHGFHAVLWRAEGPGSGGGRGRPAAGACGEKKGSPGRLLDGSELLQACPWSILYHDGGEHAGGTLASGLAPRTWTHLGRCAGAELSPWDHYAVFLLIVLFIFLLIVLFIFLCGLGVATA